MIVKRYKDVVVANLTRDGSTDEVIFYTLPHEHKVGVVVAKRFHENYTRVWEEVYDDSSGFYNLTGVYDLNKSGRPQIVVYRIIGASCPGVLEIYESRNGKIERISGTWADNGQCNWVQEIRDLNDDGRSEIIISSRNYGVIPDVYAWNGKRYVISNSDFPQYYNDQLSNLIRDIHSVETLSTTARVSAAKQAVEIYLLQHRYAEAVALCNDVLRIIDDLKLTKPNSIITETDTPDQLNRIAATFEIDKTEGKAAIRLLLGDIYQAAGNSPQAQAEYRGEQELQSRANEIKWKLPPLKLVPAK